MSINVAMIGFGEAAGAFAPAIAASARHVAVYDRKTDDLATRDAKLDEIAYAGLTARSTAAEALVDAQVVLSLVTADQALVVAQTATLAPGAWWFDMNSVAPDTKRAAAAAIGDRYVDVAVMSPVLPGRSRVPLLVSGPHAEQAADLLRSIGFADVTVMGERVGMASSIKMIRSVMVKGIEALSTECALAADAAGVLPQVVASLDASWPGADWGRRFDYNLDRMMVHGTRRAAEMREVVATLDALGTGSPMTRGTVERQAAIGALHIAPPDGLEHKLTTLHPFVSTKPQDRAA